MASIDLIAAGRRLRGPYLVQQAGYTVGIAHAEGAALVGLLPEAELTRAEALAAEVTEALKDKTLAAADASGATGDQNRSLRTAKIWRRRMVSRAARAERKGAKIPAGLLTISPKKTVPAVATQLADMLALADKHAAELDKAGPGLAQLLAEGQAAATALGTADAAQEVKRFEALPSAVRAFYAKKAELYQTLKVINDAGHELHAGAPEAAGRYNLKILHRAASKAPKAPKPPKAP
ncbi:MAG: hypothetical protein HY908_17365 [Myxococcales bacterium]|nr:hypothetical protein [Myxococcales bacterium]